MRKLFMIIVLTLALFIAPFTLDIQAADKILEAEITDIVASIDKNGKDYVRLIVAEDASLQGVEYEVGIPTMAFGQLVAEVKGLGVGDTLKAIVSPSDNFGRKSYTIRKVLK